MGKVARSEQLRPGLSLSCIPLRAQTLGGRCHPEPLLRGQKVGKEGREGAGPVLTASLQGCGGRVLPSLGTYLAVPASTLCPPPLQPAPPSFLPASWAHPPGSPQL